MTENIERKSAWVSMVPKLVVTIALLSFLLWKLDLRAVGSKILSLDPSWTIVSILVILAAIALSAMKWGLILCTRGFCIPYWRTVRHYFVGLFFNNVLPTTVGGDAVRAWETTKDTREVPEAVGSVVTERLVAGLALGFTALIGLPFVEVSARLFGIVVLFILIDVAMVAVFLVPRVSEGVVGSLLGSRGRGLASSVNATVGAVRDTFGNKLLILKVFVYSIIFQILVAAVNWAIFKAMGLEVGIGYCIVFTPMIFTVTMIPISLSGLGVREAAYWYFFSQIGLSQADAVTASLLFFVLVGVTSLPGAPLFLLSRRNGAQPAELDAASINREVA